MVEENGAGRDSTLTNEEDSIKEIGWRELPLFNGKAWLKALLIAFSIFIGSLYLFGNVMVTGRMSVQERELAEKKKDLELKLIGKELLITPERRIWLLKVITTIKGKITPEQKALLKSSKIDCKFRIDVSGKPQSIELIHRSNDAKKNSTAREVINSAAPYPTPVPEEIEFRTVFLSFNNSPEIQMGAR